MWLFEHSDHLWEKCKRNQQWLITYDYRARQLPNCYPCTDRISSRWSQDCTCRRLSSMNIQTSHFVEILISVSSSCSYKIVLGIHEIKKRIGENRRAVCDGTYHGNLGCNSPNLAKPESEHTFQLYDTIRNEKSFVSAPLQINIHYESAAQLAVKRVPERNI